MTRMALEVVEWLVHKAQTVVNTRTHGPAELSVYSHKTHDANVDMTPGVVCVEIGNGLTGDSQRKYAVNLTERQALEHVEGVLLALKDLRS